ncbi:MAG: FHA domain-containing protein [Drouetiella hepatica Uher 2000/2452]|uniref:FHA domain-containing protein n=1 Tax=Drouetiella hepatica Uher 2000/2452 TaxID=904376 RepID=A0A951UM88_9CYAN|nr:FHA domain-containing protein [Drouetiella hepatica Uher 2000/2452]
MIVCPNCNHQNPDAAVQCEACYTPLPAMVLCPGCGASVQADASFCGQCGFNLQAQGGTAAESQSATLSPDLESPDSKSPDLESPNLTPPDFSIPDLAPLEPLPSLEPLVEIQPSPLPEGVAPILSQPFENPPAPFAAPVAPAPTPSPAVMPQTFAQPPIVAPTYSTQLQTQMARLLHVQTNTPVELPTTLAVIHIGKPNDRIPPDVDVSGFPNSEIVSRIHADIRVEGDLYYIEDVGSSNGTYINNAPLPSGNRHRLRPGDRIALGKGDKMTFLFQIA